MTRIALGLAALTLLAMPAAASAGNPPKPRFLATSHSQVVSDDERWVAFMPSPTSLRVLDERGGASYDLPLEAGCTPVDAGAGYVLINCAGSDLRVTPYVLSARLRTVRRVGEPSNRAHYFEIGRHWLHGRDHGSGHIVRIYASWTRKGERKDSLQDDDGGVHGAAYRPRDLDRLDLAPLAPLVEGDGVFDWDAPYAVTLREPRGPGNNLLDLVLLRGGDRDAFGKLEKRLARCEAPCFSIRFGSGVTTWVQRRTVKSHRVVGDRRHAWRFRRRAAHVEHSARRAFVAFLTDRPGVFDVYAMGVK